MGKKIYGQAADALASLTPEQVSFLQSLPKAELHAHLNGCIPLSCIQELARAYSPDGGSMASENVLMAIENLRNGASLNTISDFFGLFGAIYTLTSTRDNLTTAARAVLADFLDGETKQCSYLELRSTPRETSSMSRRQYVETVLDEVEKYPKDQAAYVLSLDRKMTEAVASECLDIAVSLKSAGRRIVGVDLCGDPFVCIYFLLLLHVVRLTHSKAGDMDMFASIFKQAKGAGLGITLHIAEVRIGNGSHPVGT